MTAGTARLKCTRQRCEHPDSRNPLYQGHCTLDFCPNYMGDCPHHQERDVNGERPDVTAGTGARLSPAEALRDLASAWREA